MSRLQLDEDRKIPFETHTEHHIFLHELISSKEKRDDIKHKVISTVVIAGVLSVFSGIGTIIWHAITSFVEKGGQ